MVSDPGRAVTLEGRSGSGRVAWSSGTFLIPQLFEAQEASIQADILQRWSLSGFARWGVSALDIDTGSLATGVFRLTRCVAIFADGSVVSAAGAQLPPQRTLTVERGKSLDVFLATPERREEGRNIGNRPEDGLRYVMRDQPVFSELDGLEETIQVAEQQFQLVFGGESTTGLDLLPIARVVVGADGGYALDPSFIPPCLNAACSSYLWERLRSLLSRLHFVSAQLSRQRSRQSELLADFTDSDVRRFWVLHLVNRALPELNHVHSIGHCHPEELYRFLLRLAGGLFTFWGADDASSTGPAANAEDFGISDFPAYDHRNLGACLLPVVAQVERMLRTMVYRKRRCEALPLATVRPESHFKAGVSNALLERSQLYLALRRDPRAESDVHEDVKVVGALTRDGAETLAGLQLRLESSAPPDWPRGDGRTFYRILQPAVATAARSIRPAGRPGRDDRDANVTQRRLEVWQDVQDHEELHVIVLNREAVSDVEVLAVGPEASGYAALAEVSA